MQTLPILVKIIKSIYLIICKRHLLTSIKIIYTLTVPNSSTELDKARCVSQNYTVIDECTLFMILAIVEVGSTVFQPCCLFPFLVICWTFGDKPNGCCVYTYASNVSIRIGQAMNLLRTTDEIQKHVPSNKH